MTSYKNHVPGFNHHAHQVPVRNKTMASVVKQVKQQAGIMVAEQRPVNLIQFSAEVSDDQLSYTGKLNFLADVEGTITVTAGNTATAPVTVDFQVRIPQDAKTGQASTKDPFVRFMEQRRETQFTVTADTGGKELNDLFIRMRDTADLAIQGFQSGKPLNVMTIKT